MRQAISLSDLKRYAERLPDHYDPSKGNRYSFAVMPRPPEYHRPTDYLGYPDFHKIEFLRRPALVNGVEVSAWYYHDILVKVSV